MTEREKMVAGLAYDGADPDLAEERLRIRRVLEEVNSEVDDARRMELLADIFAALGDDSFVERPFYCDYGVNIRIGSGCFVNTNAVILDSASVEIGDRSQIGPGVQLLTADHPREASERAAGVELAKPVSLGEDTWIGAGVIVCPGVEVGRGSVVGAGSVVTRDVPEGVIAAGNPCRVIREL